jgi:TPR repeat protein
MSNDTPDAESLYELSRRHGDLWCPPQDAEHAALLIQAARLGSVQAQRDLGCCYATGDDAIEQDLPSARLWYGRAAEAGHADAQYNFGCMLLYGEGGAKDTDAGITWISRAAAQGDEAALHHLNDPQDL